MAEKSEQMVPFNVFNVQEFEPGGVFYGSNKVSNNIIVGITGGGKSVIRKLKMLQICKYSNNIIVKNRKRLKNGNAFVFGTPGRGRPIKIKEIK